MKKTLDKALYHGRVAAASVVGLSGLAPSRQRPALVNIGVTNRCNSRCRMCNCWRDKRRDPLSTERLVRLFEELVEIGVPYVRVTGGEAMIRRDLFEVLDTVPHGAFERLTLSSNGALLAKRLDVINRSPITAVGISLDGMAETHNMIRRIPGLFERATAAAEKLEGKQVGVGALVTCYLADELEELIRFCHDRGWRFDVNLPDNSPTFFAGDEAQREINRMWPEPAHVEKIIAILGHYNILPEPLLQVAQTYLLQRKLAIKHCVLGYLAANIDYDGNVHPSCYPAKPAGNILDQPLSEIVASKAYARIAENMFEMACPGCTCGYGISVIHARPWSTAGYLLRRIRASGSQAARSKR